MSCPFIERESLEDFEFYDGTFESIENKISLRLLNKNNMPENKKLDLIPHKKYMDLAVTYCVEERYSEHTDRGVYAYLITKNDLDNLGIDSDSLYEIAKNNLIKNNSVRIESIGKHLCRNSIFFPLSENAGQDVKGMFDTNANKNDLEGIYAGSSSCIVPIHDEKNILVLSNRYKTFGSTYMIFNDVMEQIYNKMNSNFYIIPTSIHELTCVSERYMRKKQEYEENEKMIIEDLTDMLEQINDAINLADTILSYNIYYYSHEDCVTMIIK